MACSAIVARTSLGGLEYLVQRQREVAWASVEGEADKFISLRDATRAAMALPSRFRAFALPVTSPTA